MTIDFFYETNFELIDEDKFSHWLSRVIKSELKKYTEINYIFCDDAYLLKMNQEYLNHDTYTDIITFDYSGDKSIGGDVFISIERVRDNAKRFGVSLELEVLRVMAHGVLHLCGYKDKTEGDVKVMRAKEEEKIKMFHVEQGK